MYIVNKIMNKMYAYRHKYNVLLHRMASRIGRKNGINSSSDRDKKIIVTLTTYPKRFDVVHLTIESIFRQSFQPDLIVLYLAKDELQEGKIPRHISKLQKRGLRIKLVDENLKSYKKLIYALEEYSDAILITVDDDIIYPTYFIEKLYDKHLEYPKEIIAYRCSIIKKKTDNELMPYLSWQNANNSIEPSFDLFFTGVGGVLYPPKSLAKEVTDKKLFLALAPNADDVWFKAMSLLNNTKIVQVFEKFIEFPIINQKSQETALWRTNNGLQENDSQLKKVFDYFNLYTYIPRTKGD